MKTILSGLAGAVLALSVPAQAQNTPPCQSTEYRAFDFWVGEWDVFTPDGTLAGTNSITVEENGCLLLEKWTNAQGGTGQSYNFYDPATKKFRQLWVSRGAVIDYGGGLNEDGAMVMEGTIAYHNGQTADFRGTWTKLEDGAVRQYFQQYDSTQGTWNDWFTGIYKKRD